MSTNQEGRGVEIVVSTRFLLIPPIDDREPAELLATKERRSPSSWRMVD